ncbi:MAG: integrase core domain-containing protein, partial [Pseudomonadota bacterium]|nr:integrase core domain-containing protein [Pseudomonadota bacterium]
RHGRPRFVRTDNEPVYGSPLFRQGLALLGIRHQQTEPHCPWQNGRVERFFGTLKNKLDEQQVEDAKQLDQELGVFRTWYNRVRPHQNLAGRTPFEAWRGVDFFARRFRLRRWFSAWDGLLQGEIYLS